MNINEVEQIAHNIATMVAQRHEKQLGDVSVASATQQLTNIYMQAYLTAKNEITNKMHQNQTPVMESEHPKLNPFIG